MKFNDPSHVYRCIPPVLGIRGRYEAQKAAREIALAAGVPEAEAPTVDPPVTLGLKGVFRPDIDKMGQDFAIYAADHGPDKLQAFRQEQEHNLTRDKLAYIENLVVGETEVKDFATFYRIAPPELVEWVKNVIYSTEGLTAAEAKNS